MKKGKKCETCKSIFSPRIDAWTIKNNRGRFCSRSCSKLMQNNPQWKEIPSLKAIHLWVRARLPIPDQCNDCGRPKPRDLANISQQYKRNLKDWEWLCRKCHMEKDGRKEKLREYSIKNQRYFVRNKKGQYVRLLPFYGRKDKLRALRGGGI